MKLILCEKCWDVVKLSTSGMRFCECGNVYGRYINNSEAEVSKSAVSIALGNGAVYNAILAMREIEKGKSRDYYIRHSPIEAAWVRPNSGDGNPHTKICQDDIRALKYVSLELIEPTNTKLNNDVVAGIVAEGWDAEQGKAIPVWFDGKKYLPTDGNHRIEALKQLGSKFAPVVELTKEEFDHVKFSKNTIEFMVHEPERPLFVTSMGQIHRTKQGLA